MSPQAPVAHPPLLIGCIGCMACIDCGRIGARGRKPGSAGAVPGAGVAVPGATSMIGAIGGPSGETAGVGWLFIGTTGACPTARDANAKVAKIGRIRFIITIRRVRRSKGGFPLDGGCIAGSSSELSNGAVEAHNPHQP